jgi:sulfoacetaldehyde acetyltransferase
MAAECSLQAYYPGPIGPTTVEGQMKRGNASLIEANISQELGEPFRRDAMKKPVPVAHINKADMRPQKGSA